MYRYRFTFIIIITIVAIIITVFIVVYVFVVKNPHVCREFGLKKISPSNSLIGCITCLHFKERVQIPFRQRTQSGSDAIQPSVQWVPRYTCHRTVRQTTHLHPATRLRMLAAVTPLSQYFVWVRLDTETGYEIRVKK